MKDPGGCGVSHIKITTMLHSGSKVRWYLSSAPDEKLAKCTKGKPIYHWGKQTSQIVDSQRHASQPGQIHPTADGGPQTYRHSLAIENTVPGERESNDSDCNYQNGGSRAVSLRM